MPKRLVIIRNGAKERDRLGIQFGRHYHIDGTENNKTRLYSPAAYRTRNEGCCLNCQKTPTFNAWVEVDLLAMDTRKAWQGRVE